MSQNLICHLVKEINQMADKEMKIMEVCGTHTQMISKLGIRSLLPKNIKLVSGPGCPVCVTDELYIDTTIEMLNQYPVTVATFGDLMKVTGTKGSLLDERMKGKDVRVIYSPWDLIEMAESQKEKNFVFLGVGFETTAPTIALTIKTAAEKGIHNLFFLTSLKLMDPILHYILKQPQIKIQGMICPGHVAAIKGADYFKFITEDYGIPAAVCGFEALDIVGGIYYLVKQITQEKEKLFANLYRRCVRPKGNPIANQMLKDVFKISHGIWRGIGWIENSFLKINERYQNFDAENQFFVKTKLARAKVQCECSEILLGNKTPMECKLFNKPCNPMNPCGPCMVSTEGACAIVYRYRED